MKRWLVRVLLVCIGVTCVSPAAAQDAECAEGTYLVVHDLGETCVPVTVERVVTLEHVLTELALTVGVQPVGVADVARFDVLVDFPVELDETVVDVGTRNEPNLEVITQLEPDLILAASFRVGESYDELSAIAPTLTFSGSDNLEVMLEMFNTVATALNREAEGEAAVDAMEAHFDDAQAALEAAELDESTFILSQNWVEESLATFRLFTDNAMAVEILERIGLENAWDAEPMPDGFTVVGIEGLADLEDTNFFYHTDQATVDFFAESELWNALPFVQAEHDYWLGEKVWFFGGPVSAQKLVSLTLDAMGVEIITPEATPAS